MILRNPHLVIRNAEDLVALYHKYSNNDSTVYEFCIVETMPPFQREKKEDRAFIRIPNIMKQHEIHFYEGGLIAKEVPCMQCAQIDRLCDACRCNLKYTVSPDKVSKALAGWQDPTCDPQHDVLLNVEGLDIEDEILEQSDSENDEFVDETNEDEGDAPDAFPVGTVVWGLRYIFYCFFLSHDFDIDICD